MELSKGDAATVSFSANSDIFPAIFISDVHLGTKNCQAETLLTFLKTHKTGHIYLVGNFFNNWRPLGRNWKSSHHELVRYLLNEMQSGTKLTYTPGNHDAFFHSYMGLFSSNLTIVEQTYHTTSNGTKFLIAHGDSVDVFSRWFPFVTRIGARIESIVQHINAALNWVRRSLGMSDWLGSNSALSRFHRTVRKYDRFEERLSRLAIDQGADGVICGHFHQSALHIDFGTIYTNCGDWVENYTALIENSDGELEPVDWGSSVTIEKKTHSDLDKEPIGVGV